MKVTNLSTRRNIGMGRRQDRDEWMDVAMVITSESTGTNPIYCHRDSLVCCDNIAVD